MCRAFSGLITKSKRVYWEAGIDSHDDLIKKFEPQDIELKDDKDPTYNTFAKFEIIPHNGDYLKPNQKWDFILDERIKPFWWTKDYEKPCRLAFQKWKKQVYNFNLQEAKNPINPFTIEPPKITNKHLKLLQTWASVRNSIFVPVKNSMTTGSVKVSVWVSIRDSIGDLVRPSIGISVWASVEDSVRLSVEDSIMVSVCNSVGIPVWVSVRDAVGAYIGSLFPNIKKWKYTDKLKLQGYPFQSVVDLWKMGLVPGFDGKKWMLLGGEQAKILWEGTKKDLNKLVKNKK